ncbi:MAG: PLDc N-terminal domain-containing protein [Solirubrobacteraceae bacterium]|nr:PLDc N-terminal domain-containing protein [Solirubrobacteraceae bacterium]
MQLALLLSALNDLRRRPQDQINGPKKLWFVAVFVNFIGPATYFRFGRKE